MFKRLKSCKFYYLNIRGLKSKIESLKEIIIQEKPEVIGIVETMLDAKDEVDWVTRFTRDLFELPCYPRFELKIHIIEVSYFTYILIK